MNDYWFWVPLTAPCVGAVLGGAVYRGVFRKHLPEVISSHRAFPPERVWRASFFASMLLNLGQFHRPGKVRSVSRPVSSPRKATVSIFPDFGQATAGRGFE
jgi:hypothetical protein